ncbi:hypothetical protein GCM10009677_36090 [Sphaerisporangium rubeum]|uniref:Uncharacterized protein n=1 Tax=Sphaerisporangium rubeum TaxID=321317 RepID=A0A7X0M513_9ACTN|nr:hypothetical protein [Sphaerisporangium rubeum]MBB6471845.1 hypothetical protein [Sphaerisporangium rubeum]
MAELGGLTARERQLIIDEFVEQAFAGIDPDATGARIAEGMRILPQDAPDELQPEKAAAWAELTGLLADGSFRDRVRQMAVTGARGQEEPRYDPAPITEHAGAAVAAGVAPDSAQAKEIVDRVVGAGATAEEKATIAGQIETFADRRVERYWELMGVLNDRPAFPSAVPAFEWFAAALRAHA